MNQGEVVDSDLSAPTVLVAASGSGGHLMPAKLIAEALHEKGYQVAFVGSGRRLEEEIFAHTNFSLHTIPITGLNNLGLRGVCAFFAKLPKAFYETVRLFTTLRPVAVVGVGGYASVLPVVVAKFFGIPRWIHEAELEAGNANRFLAQFATKISVAFEETDAFPRRKMVFTGHPLRSDVAALAGSAPAHIPPKNLLILGGSQGARAVDAAIEHLAERFQQKGLALFHQCRPESVDHLQRRYEELSLPATVQSFIQDLGEAYQWSDIIICRAGAGTVMEIGVVNRPTIFVPFPHAQGKHQHKNAATLTEKGKALMVEEGENFAEELWQAFESLLSEERFREMLEAPPASRPLNAAARIAEGVSRLIS
ncbi:undecaprenyldiphospho-muramoylpentapeptide beta-N-acetylglucosaminyltransferase [bacterium]|nr:undecaprenyldiphospho-muramoylpentapeptide beta-N-acetylglucosaminyltransferase [bacterium]